MEGICKIVWSKRALSDLDEIICYLQENWTEKEIRKFSQKLDHLLDILQSQPFLFPESGVICNTYRAVLSKHISIYYQVGKNEIHLITLFDNRQDPEKLK